MEFVYEALNKQGQPVAGKVTAENQAEANERLREAGVIVTKIDQVRDTKKKKRGKKHERFYHRSRYKVQL